tara:strand:- start:298 stop:588 length:291 start_codon:yes stop_codon:yes gene_type:complete
MIKGMSDRKFPMWGLINAAREQQMLESGQAVIQTDLTGNQVLMPATPAAPTPAEIDDQIAGLKKEINQTQGRALSKVEANINARLDRFEELLTSPE